MDKNEEIPQEKSAKEIREDDRIKARATSNLPPDGNLKPHFDGTQPKILKDGTVALVSMQELKQASADKDGETVAQQEEAAGLVVGQSVSPHVAEQEKVLQAAQDLANESPEEEAPEEEAAEEEEGNMTVAELKEALDAAGVEYTSSMRKAELQELYDNI